VGRLSTAQVRALLAGEITDWAQVGAAAGPVQVVVPPAGSEAARLLDQAVLQGTPPTTSALLAPGWEAMRALVGEDGLAVGVLPRAELTAALRAAEWAEEARVLIVAEALAEPTGPARAFLAWAQSAAGQAVVGERYEPVE
jgi:hypothetical protein